MSRTARQGDSEDAILRLLSFIISQMICLYGLHHQMQGLYTHVSLFPMFAAQLGVAWRQLIVYWLR